VRDFSDQPDFPDLPDLPADAPHYEQPALRDVPAEEQFQYVECRRQPLMPRILVLGGVALVCGAVLCWKNLDFDYSVEDWKAYLPGLAFLSALCGVVIFFYGIYLTLLEPRPRVQNTFAAWGRFGLGIAFTTVGLVGKKWMTGRLDVPPDAVAVATLAVIGGPVLCAWACYGTFVKDRTQQVSGVLMMLAIAAFLIFLLTSPR
jgi:hypothetical protein